MTGKVDIIEVSPRDGLQNEKVPVSTEDKIRLINKLAETGLKEIEATSFVSPRAVPQMADAAEVMAGISRKPGIKYTALAPNLKGYLAAKAAGVDEVAVFASASEGFSKANINCTIAESLERFRPVTEAAKADGIPVRGYISCVVACPYDGPVAPRDVATVTAALLDMGCYEVSLGDTIGAGEPGTVLAMLERVLEVAGPEKLAGHFHDTGGKALANIGACLVKGLRRFDASAGGLGGCPYAPGASGNVATESVVQMLHGHGYETGVDLATLIVTAAFARSLRSA